MTLSTIDRLTANVSPVLTSSVPLADDAPDVCDDVRLYVAGIRELVQRVNAGTIDREARADIGGDLLAIADRLTEYAIRVLA